MGFLIKFKDFIIETKTKVIAKFTNKEDGVQSQVAEVSKGFSVVLYDLDAKQFVDTAIIYPDKKRAIAKAKEIIK